MAASTEVQDVHQLRRTFRLMSSVWPRKTEGGVIGRFREHYRISVTSSLVPQFRTFSNAMASSQYQSETVKRLGRVSHSTLGSDCCDGFLHHGGVDLFRIEPLHCSILHGSVDSARADRRHRQFSEWIVEWFRSHAISPMSLMVFSRG